MAEPGSQLVCGEEALALLNCATGAELDQNKCLQLLDALRKCVLEKKVKKFSLSDQDNSRTNDANKEKKKNVEELEE